MSADDRTALYRCFDADGALLYVGMSRDPLARTGTHPTYLRSVTATITVEWFDTADAARAAEALAITIESPPLNVQHRCAVRSHPRSVALPATRGDTVCIALGVTVPEWLIVRHGKSYRYVPLTKATMGHLREHVALLNDRAQSLLDPLYLASASLDHLESGPDELPAETLVVDAARLLGAQQ